jgi:hypothetical protein
MKVLYSFFSVMFFLFLIACEGPTGPQGPIGETGQQGSTGNDGTSDKQIRIEFESFSNSTTDTAWVFTHPLTFITNFDKDYYVGVDSLIFNVNIGSTNLNTNCIVELFNLTDNQPISNSLLFTNDTTKFPYSFLGGKWCKSANLLNSFPNKEITVAVRFKSDRYGTLVNINKGMLLLYRD